MLLLVFFNGSNKFLMIKINYLGAINCLSIEEATRCSLLDIIPVICPRISAPDRRYFTNSQSKALLQLPVKWKLKKVVYLKILLSDVKVLGKLVLSERENNSTSECYRHTCDSQWTLTILHSAMINNFRRELLAESNFTHYVNTVTATVNETDALRWI